MNVHQYSLISTVVLAISTNPAMQTGLLTLTVGAPLAETTLQTSSKSDILHWEGWTEPLDLHQPILSLPKYFLICLNKTVFMS
jgi:hypothetical protein